MLAHARLASRSRASRALRWAAAPCGDSSAGAHCWPAGESRALNGALPQQHPPCSHALPAQTRVPPITTTTSTSGLARFSAIPDNNDIVPRSKNAVGTSPATQDEWTPVPHEQSGLVYYWNKRTGETTALGEAKPGPGGRLQRPSSPLARPGTSLLGLVGMGAGVGLVFSLLARIF